MCPGSQIIFNGPENLLTDDQKPLKMIHLSILTILMNSIQS